MWINTASTTIKYYTVHIHVYKKSFKEFYFSEICEVPYFTLIPTQGRPYIVLRN